MNLKKLNKYVGWSIFLIATMVYLFTVEETTSLWDCGEYITTAYKLEVGHPPGAPLFMMLGRLFSLFGGAENAAYMVNVMSALSSSFTILFLFWTITLLGKKIALSNGKKLTDGNTLAIIGSATVGSLVYTFSDSFWFSAVEGEVYAMASLFTAIVFWAILKWDDEVRYKKQMLQDTGKSSIRWIIFIMFILGLAIGVHLLGLLAIPAVAFVIYFNHYKASLKGIIYTGIIGVFLLGFIQEGIIPGIVEIASIFERTFVNNFGMPFYFGTIFFFTSLVGLIVFGLYITRKKGLVILNTTILSFGVLLIGYSCFAMIVIRSNANTPLDENDPENLVTLHSYLKREQYGDFPLISGQYYNSKPNTSDKYDDRSPVYMRRWVVRSRKKDVKGFKSKELAEQYIAKNGGKLVDKYYMSNDGKNQKPTYKQTTFFPRMYATTVPEFKKDGYKNWSGYADNILDKSKKRKKRIDKSMIGTDGKRIPTFSENISYFLNYQVNFMYLRYFLWNFSGRQNDIQGYGDILKGNWKTGFDFIDSERLGSQINTPNYTKNNPSNNSFYLLPLILGLIGLVFHFIKDWRSGFVVTLLFFLTGLAIVIYLNQKPFEPRERDYAYAGSFYAFAIWIGFSVYGLYEAATKLNIKKWLFGIGIWGFLAIIYLISGVTDGEFSSILTWIVMGVISALMMAIMYLVKNSNEKLKVLVAFTLTIFTPIIMGVQGWDDHDRSDRTTAKDLAYNYLIGVGKNGVLFANGDNDTFPLWYLQEVEGVRTDVRVSNLSLLDTDWYTEQMTYKAYDSEPLPIRFSEDQYRMSDGFLDVVYFSDLFDLFQQGWKPQKINKAIKVIKDNNPQEFYASYYKLTQKIKGQITNPNFSGRNELESYALELDTISKTMSLGEFVKYHGSKIIPLLQNGKIDTKTTISLLQTINLKDFPPVDIKYVSSFIENEKNLTSTNSSRKFMMIPFQNIYINVDKDTVEKYKYVSENELPKLVERVNFKMDGNLSKADIVMFDIIANNDWKRMIQFTSPSGSTLIKALAAAGHVSMEGMIYKLTPAKLPGIRLFGIVNVEELYNNLMNVYKWGGIKNDVLVDYYVRRHTNNYRMMFYAAAKSFLDLNKRYTNDKNRIERQMKLFTEESLSNPTIKRNYDIGLNSLKQVEENLKTVANANQKALELINKSLKELPIGSVIEYGESKNHFLHKYVEILYEVDAPNKEQVSIEVIKLLEDELNYYLSLDSDKILSNKNVIATAQGYLMEVYSFIKQYDPNSGLIIKLNTLFKDCQMKIEDIENNIKKIISKNKRAKRNRKIQENLGFLSALKQEFVVETK